VALAVLIYCNAEEMFSNSQQNGVALPFT